MRRPEFDNRFTRLLTADSDTSNRRRSVQQALYARVNPTPVRAPKLLALATDLADQLGLDSAWTASAEFAQVMGGSQVLPNMAAHATVYGGHQFGNWAGQLGDGRAINLGEMRTPAGDLVMLQLKGAGPTPFSRTADGRAVLRSSLREYLCSEAMQHLGIPSTRALSLVGTGEPVMRDMFYDGNPAPEPGAVVCRVAPSFLRFGHYELPTSRGDITLLRQLVDYTIRELFPDLIAPDTPPDAPLSKPVILAFYARVVSTTAELINHWMRVGFVHGVLNTDNLSILGLGIDYGPYGWLEAYDENWTPNTTDAREHRYAYGRQPRIGLWNLAQLGSHLYPLVEDAPALQAILDTYVSQFAALERARWCAKLGIEPSVDEAEDATLIAELKSALATGSYDYTGFFRALADCDFSVPNAASDTHLQTLERARYARLGGDTAPMLSWLGDYAARVAREKVLSGKSFDTRRADMNRVNPKYIFRNYLAQQAIDALQAGDDTLLARLHQVLRHPYDEQPEADDLAALRPEWADARAGCSSLSCSS